MRQEVISQEALIDRLKVNGIAITEDSMRRAEQALYDQACKKCFKEQKRNGSKYCQSCSDEYKKQS